MPTAFFTTIPRTRPRADEWAAARAVFALNEHFIDSEDGRGANVVMKLVIGHKEAQAFGEAVMYIVNQLGCPCEKPRELQQVLKVLLDIYTPNEPTMTFFYANDQHVLVDIIVRECTDLPAPDEMRCRYLELLHRLLLHSTWAQGGRYRHEDICSTMESIIDIGQQPGSRMHSSATEMAEKIICDCVSLLE